MPTKTKRTYEKKRNRFMSLRYGSETAEYPIYTLDNLVTKFDNVCCKSTLSKLEKEDADEDKLLSTSARILKKYHEVFNCSYEYLFGETDISNHNIDPNSPLLKLERSFLDNLEQMLTDSEFDEFNKYMLTAILADPQALQNIMATVFEQMYIIDQIYKDPKLHKAEKAINTSKYWANINENIGKYLTNNLLPHLQRGFSLYEEKEIERGEEIVNLASELEEKSHAPITGTLVIDDDK